MRWAYLLLIFWQPIWHCYFIQRGLVGLLWMLPLLMALPWIWRQHQKARAVGGFIMLLYVITGVTELWANPEERWLAAVQLTLCVAYLLPLIRHGWAQRRQAKNTS